MGENGLEDPKMVLHVVFMIMSWMCLTPIAITAAWHTKDVLIYPTIKPNHKKPDHSEAMPLGLNKPLWFNLHIFSNILASVLTFAGLILAIIKLGDWYPGDLWANFDNKHETFGLATILLCMMLFAMGLTRPGPKDDNRVTFNWLHGILGFLAQIIAFITVWKGIDFWEWYGISKEEGKVQQLLTFLLYWTEVSIFVSGFIVLEVLKRVKNSRCVNDTKALKLKQIMEYIFWGMLVCCVVLSILMCYIIVPPRVIWGPGTTVETNVTTPETNVTTSN